MNKIISALFVSLLFVFCGATRLTSPNLRAACSTYGSDCDADWFSHYCCSPYKCIDYRCQEKDAKELLDWAPKGAKCNVIHKCPKHFECNFILILI